MTYWRLPLISLYYSHYSQANTPVIGGTVKRILSLCVALVHTVGLDILAPFAHPSCFWNYFHWHRETQFLFASLLFIVILSPFLMSAMVFGYDEMLPLLTYRYKHIPALTIDHPSTGRAHVYMYYIYIYIYVLHLFSSSVSSFMTPLSHHYIGGGGHSASRGDGRTTARQNKEKEKGHVHVRLIYCWQDINNFPSEGLWFFRFPLFITECNNNV